MNQNLRTRHRSLITLVAVITPIVFAAALVTRPQAVTMENLPAQANDSVANMTQLMSRTINLDGSTVSARILQNSQGELTVQFIPAPGEAVGGADVLVYWQSNNTDSDGVPPEANLLGTLAGTQTRVFTLPGNKASGQLMFYSLAHKRMYDDIWSLSQ